MKINEQLFKDVLSGKLKGTFVLRNGDKVKSSKLSIDTNPETNYPISLDGYWYAYRGEYDLARNSNIDIINFIPDTDMKENELTIEIPDGKIVDWEESKKQNKIVLKDKQLTYADVCKKMLSISNGTFYYVGANGKVLNEHNIVGDHFPTDANSASSKHQLECILAKNKLANVAVYLNDGWKPNKGDMVFMLSMKGDFENSPWVEEYYFGAYYSAGEYLTIFKTKELAQRAIEILGEETIKLALEPLGI